MRARVLTRESEENLVTRAIRAGNLRPGPIATATHLGATKVYNLLEDMIREGKIAISKDGRLSVAGEKDGI